MGFFCATITSINNLHTLQVSQSGPGFDLAYTPLAALTPVIAS